MKKSISFLIFLVIGSVVLMASYHRNKDERTAQFNYLTNHPWKFSRAESTSDQSALVVNTLYENSAYAFNTTLTYEGLFFERPISGTWEFMGENKIVLNKGTIAEEIYEIIELDSETLAIQTMQKGNVVTLVYE